MKTLLALCALVVAGIINTCTSHAGNLQSLPIGTRGEIDEHLGNVFATLKITVRTGTTNVTVNVTNTPNSGSISNTIATNLLALCKKTLTQADAGKLVTNFFDIVFYSETFGVDISMLWDPITYYPRQFPVAFDSNTNLVIPYDRLLLHPLTIYTPMPGIMQNVESVEHILRDATGHETHYSCTPNGMDTNAWCYKDSIGDGVLYLESWFADKTAWPDWLIPWVDHAEVILNYRGGGREVFDIFTGDKISSSAVQLDLCLSNSIPCVTVHGWPGKSVTIETSNLGGSWIVDRTVTLGVQGTASFSLSNSVSPLFVRTRCSAP